MGKKISISDLAPVFRENRRFALCSHTRPDGDAIGSLVALKAVLEAQGKEVVALNEDGVPENLLFLEGTEGVRVPGDGVLEADVFIALDTANKARLGERCLAMSAEVPLWVNIDHHVSNEGYGDLVLVEAEAAAVGEIVYRIILEFGWPMPEEARDALYVAVSTDTGSFQYANTGERTHRMAGDLVRRGVPVGRINSLIYHDFPYRRVELLKALLDTLERTEDGRIAWWVLRQDVKEQLGMVGGDTEGLVDVMRAIRGVVLCVFFEEVPGAVRLSMRSKDERVDVCRVCSLFGGGGHVLAAGARVEGTWDEVRERVLEAARAEVRAAGLGDGN